MGISALLLWTSPAAAQPCVPFPDCVAPTTQAALEQTWTATAQGTGLPYWTPGPTPTLGTPEFLDPFATPTATRTPGVNLTCPEEVFDTNALEYEWARVCSACVEAVRGTPTPPFGMAVGAFPTLNLSTFTPVPSGTLAPTATPSPTFTATMTPTGTLSPTPTPVSAVLKYSNFALGAQDGWVLNQSPDWWYGVSFLTGFWNGSGWQSNKNPSDNGHNVAIMVDLGAPAYITSVLGASTPPVSGSNWLHVGRLTPTGSNVYAQQAGFATPNVVARYIAVQMTSSGSLGSAAITSVEIRGYYVGGTPTPTLTPSPTLTPTATATLAPTSTPQWWATSFPQYAGVSVDCSEPLYIDLNKPLVDWHIGAAEHEPVCLTVLPLLYISFELINNTAGQVFGFQIPPIDFQQVNVCFVGISVTINFLGFQLDMSILLGVPILAMLLRWVLFQ